MPEGNDLRIYEKMKYGFCEFKMIDADVCRIDKIPIIRSFVDNYDFFPTLHVCFRKKGGNNCSKCSKCYRTMLDLVICGEDPNLYGLKYEDGDLYNIIDQYSYHRLEDDTAFMDEMQNKLIKNSNDLALYEELKWIIDYDPFAPAMWSPKQINPKWDKIVIYGAGNAGRDYVRLIKPSWKIVMVVDKAWDTMELLIEGYRVRAPEEMVYRSFDKVLIAIDDDKARNDVKQRLILEPGIDEEKIYAEKPVKKYGGAKFLYFH